MPPSVRVVIASDGKPGHHNQSRVLARILGDTEPLILRLRNMEGGLSERWLRAQFFLRGTAWLGQKQAARLVPRGLQPEDPSAFRQFAHEVGKHREDYRIFTVSSGTPSATLSLVLSRLLSAEPVVNMTPTMLPRRLFKLCVVPEHDLEGRAATVRPKDGEDSNIVMSPLALGYHDVVAARMQASALLRNAGLQSAGRYWALAVGGPSRSAEWRQALFEAKVLRLLRLADQQCARLLVTSSRRSTRAAREFLLKLEAQARFAWLVDSVRDKVNPLPAYHELAEAFIVTGDSFSMITETIQVGFVPLLLYVGEYPRGHLRSGIEDLARQGLVRYDTGGADVVPRGGAEPNRYYDELRPRVRAKLGLEPD